MKWNSILKKSTPLWLVYKTILSLACGSVTFESFLVEAFTPTQSLVYSVQRVNSPSYFIYSARSSSLRVQPDYKVSGGDGTAVVNRKNENQRRRKQKKKKKKKKKISNDGKRDRDDNASPLSNDDLAVHVHSQYTNGPGDFYRELKLKRERQSSLTSYDHISYLNMLDRHPALVLNADYQPLDYLPLSLWSWQETVKAVFAGKVVVVDVYPDINIKAVNLEIPLPSVVALSEYVAQPSNSPAFTRKNVFLRDGYKCQYCASSERANRLSLDHVVPRSLGGRLQWDNAVTCCRKCNGRKGALHPSNLSKIGMKLIRPPRVPTKYELAAEAGKLMPRKVNPTWKPYLGLMADAQYGGAEEDDGDGSKTYLDDMEVY